MRLRTYLLGAGLIATGAAAYFGVTSFRLHSSLEQVGPGKNILLISIDTLRRDALGCFGAAPGSSPNLDAFAREAVAFDQATCASNFTAPSHASMLTGVSPRVHGVLNTMTSSPRPIPADLPTLAERLKSQGYATGAETDRGYVSEPFGFRRGFDTWREEYTGTAPKIDRALAWFEALPADRSGFYFLHTYEVHAPYIPPATEFDKLEIRFPESEFFERLKKLQLEGHVLERGHSVLFADKKSFKENDIQCLKALYAATVKSMDEAIGKLISGLRSRGILDKTLVIITSDHGEEFHEHGGFQHDSLFDVVMRVPLLIRMPGALRGGTRATSPFPSISLVPTVLALLKLAPPSGIEGKDLSAVLQGSPSKEVTFASAVEYRGEHWQRTIVRIPRLKLTHNTDTSFRDGVTLIDLLEDPQERSPKTLVEVAQGMTLLNELQSMMAVWSAMAERYKNTMPAGPIEKTLLEQMKSLGYAR